MATTPLYELVYITRQELAITQVEALTEALEKLIRDQQGSVLKREFWGQRNLAYPINKNTKGHYVLLNVQIAPAGLKEVEKSLRFNENVLRFMSLRIPAVDKEPSAILRTRNEDDGDRRGERAERAVA